MLKQLRATSLTLTVLFQSVMSLCGISSLDWAELCSVHLKLMSDLTSFSLKLLAKLASTTTSKTGILSPTWCKPKLIWLRRTILCSHSSQLLVLSHSIETSSTSMTSLWDTTRWSSMIKPEALVVQVAQQLWTFSIPSKPNKDQLWPDQTFTPYKLDQPTSSCCSRQCQFLHLLWCITREFSHSGWCWLWLVALPLP